MLDCLKFCGNSLEISNQEMSTMVHDSSMLSNDCENGTAMILHDDDVLEEKKLHNSHRKSDKSKKLKKQEVKSSSFAR